MEIKQLLRIILFLSFIIESSYGQDQFIDTRTKQLFDSLDNRIKCLQDQIPRLSKARSMKYVFKKRELDHTIFLSLYHHYIFDEDLEKARILIESRIKAAKKRYDSESVKFYNEYASMLTMEQINQQRRYQQLFAKEKIFKKELYRYIEAGGEYSLKRAERMVMLAMKYAVDKNLESVQLYMIKYQHLIKAFIFDYYSDFDLEKLTSSTNQFNKVFLPLVESDSLGWMIKAGEMVDHCYYYSAALSARLDTNFFVLQKNVVATSISDYHDRVGNKVSLASIEGQSIIARLDTLNREGIYKWHDKILVVGHFYPDGKSEQVKSGEAIISADRKLIKYIRVNRLARMGGEVKMGHTYLIPYETENVSTNFLYNPSNKKYQYMVCYTSIVNQNTTREISKFLPPLQFKIELATTDE